MVRQDCLFANNATPSYRLGAMRPIRQETSAAAASVRKLMFDHFSSLADAWPPLLKICFKHFGVIATGLRIAAGDQAAFGLAHRQDRTRLGHAHLVIDKESR